MSRCPAALCGDASVPRCGTTPRHGAGQALAQRGDVLFEDRHLRSWTVGDPAGQFTPGPGDGMGGQKRMVQATELHADHENGTRPEIEADIRQRLAGVQRNEPAACALHDGEVEAAREGGTAMIAELLGSELDPGLLGGDVGGDGGFECNRVDRGVVEVGSARSDQLQRVVIDQMAVLSAASRGDGFQGPRSVGRAPGRA